MSGVLPMRPDSAVMARALARESGVLYETELEQSIFCQEVLSALIAHRIASLINDCNLDCDLLGAHAIPLHPVPSNGCILWVPENTVVCADQA